MALTDSHKQLISASWSAAKASVGNDLGDMGVKLFVRLFTDHPGIQVKFPYAEGMGIPEVKESPKIRSHGNQVLSMIDTAVAGLGNMDAVAGVLTALGKRHVKFNIKPDHFASLGDALYWTLSELAGEAFTPDARAAWVILYGIVTSTISAQF